MSRTVDLGCEGESPKNKGKGRGVMVGVLWRQVKANPGRGKPYNFAKPEAPHSKPQPCAAAELRLLEKAFAL